MEHHSLSRSPSIKPGGPGWGLLYWSEAEAVMILFRPFGAESATRQGGVSRGVPHFIEHRRHHVSKRGSQGMQVRR